MPRTNKNNQLTVRLTLIEAEVLYETLADWLQHYITGHGANWKEADIAKAALALPHVQEKVGLALDRLGERMQKERE